MALFDVFRATNRHEKAAGLKQSQVDAVSALAEKVGKLTDDELKARVTQYRGKTLAELIPRMPEIFAAVREASERVLELRHFDVQLTGGLVLLDGGIAEMKTGEGKTLVATAPLILHALTGKGAHLVTVNDYLAERDAEWMRPLYEFFDMKVGVVLPGMSPEEKRAAYGADITYGTNNEFGFDYLRDNMAGRAEDMVQRELNYAIVDEVDSILIDEARTPLIISAPDQESTQLYPRFAQLVPKLKEGADYNIDEKRKAATLTDEGVSKVEGLLGIDNIYEEGGMRQVHHLEQALRANALYSRDRDYVVRDGQVIIVDEFTGRLMEGRRYSEGLHQAIEAKEGVAVQQESRTLATITFQNFFRLYNTLAGMTGTAVTSAEEFEKVYNLDVTAIPTNQTIVRNDKPDRIFVTENAKFAAVVRELKERYEKGQPVLVGTIAIEKSEYLSRLLQKEGVEHEVLNAKQHAREAEIITKAGQRGAVTISTNMAGRGTDIKLGEGVADLGGLFVLGTERHEARRIDNQLRGRSGRQGDAGETQFFVSMEDDVMRVFGGERIRNLMQRLRLPEDEPIENRLVTKAIESAQERVEGHYFDMRKQVLSYDDVLNRQRQAIYTLRRGVLVDQMWREGSNEERLADHVGKLADEFATRLVAVHIAEGPQEAWNVEEIAENVSALTGQAKSDVLLPLQDLLDEKAADGPVVVRAALSDWIGETFEQHLAGRKERYGRESMERLGQAAAMRAIDMHWMDHLDTMEYLRTGIGLRGYGQRDPLVEYQREGFNLFQKLLGTIKASLLDVVFRAEPTAAAGAPRAEQPSEQQLSGGQEGSAAHGLTAAPLKNKNRDLGRNDPCPCGSGKKYKKCGLINSPEHIVT